MAAPLTFRPAGQFHPGVVYAILAECYADVLDAPLQDSLRQFDLTITAFPDTVGACSLISTVNDETVGFCSYDPRQGPEIGIVGHNGILPPFQRRGYGTQQILEIVRVLALRRFARVIVTTSEDPFFLPARKMYEKCGFRRSVRPLYGGPNPRGIVCYERPVAQDF
jgi:GNAT superfamily N-acetyltransferase